MESVVSGSCVIRTSGVCVKRLHSAGCVLSTSGVGVESISSVRWLAFFTNLLPNLCSIVFVSNPFTLSLFFSMFLSWASL